MNLRFGALALGPITRFFLNVASLLGSSASDTFINQNC